MEFIAGFTNRPPEMNPGQARYMSAPQYALSHKAAGEPGYRVPKFEECVNDALAWYRSNGFAI